MKRLLLAIVTLLTVTSPAFAGTQTTSSPTYVNQVSAKPPSPSDYDPNAPIHQPDLLSFGAGWSDFDKSGGNYKNIADFRAEYRWGLSLLPLISNYFKSWDADIQFHPFVGFEPDSRGALYGLGGFAGDWYISHHWIFTWSEGAGLWYRGNGIRMGSVVEFRSQAELGWRFDNNIRTTLEFSHVSNAKLTNINPGQEIGGVYLHIPVGLIFGGHSY